MADSLYEAVARGIKALQSNDWSGRGAFQVSYVDVTVKEPEVTHRVNLSKFNEWLDRERGSPRDTSQRQRVRSILNS
jgi:2,3-bisphosphoglycerate-independent phosphoglycerate mutase